jgi:3-hydroxyacyl-CoA dehydrogenase
MGRGIIQLLAQAGHDLLCYDAVPGAAQKAADYVIDMVRRGVEKGRITQSEFETLASRIRPCELRVANVAEIDTLLREAAGFRMGPFELLDLTGLDVSGKVMESIYEQFQHEPRFRPSALVRPRIAAGLLGRKSGHGWYVYEGDRKREDAKPVIPPAPSGLRVWLDPLPGAARRRTLMLTAATTAEARDAAAARVLLILKNLYASGGDPHYRPSPWLARRAALGVSLLTPDPAR